MYYYSHKKSPSLKGLFFMVMILFLIELKVSSVIVTLQGCASHSAANVCNFSNNK